MHESRGRSAGCLLAVGALALALQAVLGLAFEQPAPTGNQQTRRPPAEAPSITETLKRPQYSREQQTGSRGQHRDPQVELAKRRGQLESFSMEATGLGDLEEADAIRVMMRRSRDHQAHMRALKAARNELLAGGGRAFTTSGDDMRAERATQRLQAVARHYDEILRSLLKRRRMATVAAAAPVGPLDSRATPTALRLPLAPPPQQETPPIEVSRRMAEELVDERGQAGGSGEDQEAEEEETLDDGRLGEFGSRVSLLTTRKIQPGEELLADRALARLLNYELFAARPPEGARVPLVAGLPLGGPAQTVVVHDPSPSLSGGEVTPSGEQKSTLAAAATALAANYLPRVARGRYLM